MILKTPRLLLRPMTQDDAPALFTILGDAEAMRFWHRPALPRLGTVEALLADELAAMAEGGFHYWMLVRDGDAIGSIDLSHEDGKNAWTGFLLRRDQWGLGYAGEALAAVTGHAFGTLGLIRLLAQVQDGNSRAVRLLERRGFQREESLPGRAAASRYGLSRSHSANGA